MAVLVVQQRAGKKRRNRKRAVLHGLVKAKSSIGAVRFLSLSLTELGLELQDARFLIGRQGVDLVWGKLKYLHE